MLGFLLSLINPLGSVAKSLAEAYAKKQNAQTDRERIEAERDIAQLEARQAVLIAEQGSWRTSWIRPAFAAPFVLFNAKIIIWDKMLHLGTTDALSPEFVAMQRDVFVSYFLVRGAESIVKVLKK